MRLSGVIVGLISVLASSAIVQAESLHSALAAAYRNNPSLNAQRAATRANDENLAQANSGFRPQLFATADIAWNKVTSNRCGTVVTIPGSVGVSLQQNLFNGFRTVNNVKAAKAGILASRESLRSVEQNTLLQAVNAYLSVLSTQELLSIRRQNIEFLKEQRRSSKARLEVGEGTRTDLAQSDAQLALARAQLSAAEANWATAKATYRQTIGHAAGKVSWSSGPQRLLPKGQKQAIGLGIRNHPAILASQHAVDAQAFNVKVSEGAFLPSVDATATAAHQINQQSQGTTVDVLQGKIAVKIPLYQGGQASSAVRQNKQVLSQKRILVDEARDSVRQEVVEAWTQLISARANLSANRAQLKASRLALSGVVEERNVGQRTQLDVLNAQSSVLQSLELQLQSRTTQVTSQYRLIAAVGRLNSKRLNLNVAHYVPENHTDAIKDLWFGLRTPTNQ